jgi:methionine biosynthesis protein MetW
MNANQQALAALVPANTRVLDLGCGDGTLLAHLRDAKGCTTYGVELDDTNLIACAQKGLNVIQLNLEDGLSMFGDNSFDYVLQLDTLPNIRETETALRETARVGKRGLISFANFAYCEALAAKCKLKVHDSFGLTDGQLVRTLPNLRGSEAVFVFSG